MFLKLQEVFTMIKKNGLFFDLTTGKMEGEIMTMTYRNYKLYYADCKTVPNSYDALYKKIDVIVPPDREKKSGTRGRRYSYFPAYFYDNTNRFVYATSFKAMSEELAEKQIKKYLTRYSDIERIPSREEAEAAAKNTGRAIQIV
jgi:hypothetical protein